MYANTHTMLTFGLKMVFGGFMAYSVYRSDIRDPVSLLTHLEQEQP